ncbi:MAG: hypothetical protein GX846_05950 [Deltaproteobacteria bacterium]|nr:hypothetical protein [Deltaproteobacteria bacterium]
MAKAKHLICGIHITKRLKHAVQVQEVLTEFGKHIKTRLGLHEPDAKGGPNGLLLIEYVGSSASFKKFTEKLGAITGVEVQEMIFDHP